MNENEFLGRMNTLFALSKLLYGDYMASGKKFLYAKSLREVNEDIFSLIMSSAHLLPESQKHNAIMILRHLSVWRCLWDAARDRLDPGLYDEFFFENTVTFPREEANNLLKYYNDNF